MLGGIKLGSMYWEIGADRSQLDSALAQSEAAVQRFGSSAAGHFNALTVAAGTLLAKGIEALATGLRDLGGKALQATADYQQMQIGLEGLLAREIARGDEAVRYHQTMRTLTAEEKQDVTDLTLKLDTMNARLQEKKQHLWEVQNRWTDQGLEAKTTAAEIAEYENNIAKTVARLDELQSKQGQVVTTTEKYWINTKTLSEAMPEAQKRAKELMDELAKIAVLSPYQVETIQNTFKTAMAFGYGSEEAKQFTGAILNVAAGVGASNEMLDRMAYNFAQIRMQGKVTAVDIRQLAMAGFDLNGVLQAVGKQFGVNIKTHDDFNKAIASGKITWKQFTEGFAKYAQDNFGGASERMSKTLNGLKSTFKDVFVLSFPKMLGPAAEKVTALLSRILDGFLAFRETGILDEIGAKLGEWTGNVMTNLQGLMDLPRVVKDLASTDPRNLAELRDILSQLPAGLRDLATGGADLKRALDEGGLKAAFEVVKDWAGDAWSKIKDWWDTDGEDWAKDLAGRIKGRLDSIPGKLTELGTSARDWLKDTWASIKDWWDGGGEQWAADAAGKISTWVQAIAGKIGEKVRETKDAAATWLAGVWTALKDWWDTGGEQWATDAAGKISTWLQTVPAQLATTVAEQAEAAKLWLVEVWNGIKAWWDTGGEEWAVDTANKITLWLGEAMRIAFDGLGTWVTANKDSWAITVGEILGKILAFGIDRLVEFALLPVLLGKAIASLFTKGEGDKKSGIWAEMGQAIGAVARWIGDVIKTAVTTAIEDSAVLQAIMKAGIWFVDSLVNSLENAKDKLVDWLKNLLTNIWGFVFNQGNSGSNTDSGGNSGRRPIGTARAMGSGLRSWSGGIPALDMSRALALGAAPLRAASDAGYADLLPPITVNVYAAGGSPDAVRRYANMGTLEALRSRGYR